MPIKTVILDRDGTLYNEYTGKLQDGVREMLDELLEIGLQLFVVSGEARDKKVEQLIDLPPSQFYYQTDCGNKGSKKFVNKVLEASGSARNEVIYLGDSEQDMWEAANSLVLYFNAQYSNGGYEYGIPIEVPAHLPMIVRDFLSKDALWYYTLSGADKVGRTYDIRSLIDPKVATKTGIRNLVKGWSVSDDAEVNGYELTYYLVIQLLGSMYLDGLHLNRVAGKRPIFCLYPGHAGEYGDVLKLFEQFAAKQLNVASLDDLLVRHTPTKSSKQLRIEGKQPEFVDQPNSVLLNAEYGNRIKGNIITVVDDFCTDGNAMECARNLLYAAGAKEVVSVSVGKYGANYIVRAPKTPFKLKAGDVLTCEKGHFGSTYLNGQTDADALDLY